MAIYDNLPVFKDTYDLLLQFVKLSIHLQRDFRYTIGERLKAEMMDLCICIYKANAAHDKSAFIGEAREKIVTIKINIRVLHDVKQLSTKQYVILVDRIETVSKQLSAWDKYIKKKEEKNIV